MLDGVDWVIRAMGKVQKEDLVEGILPWANDFMMLAGRTGIGKTMLTLHLGLCIATGIDWFGFKVKKANVAYMGFEGAEQKMKDRLVQLWSNLPPIDSGAFKFELRKPLKLTQAKIPELVRQVEGCQVVILDPLKYMVPGDYCKPSDAALFLMNLKQFMVDANVAVILTHHIRKGNNANLLIEPGDLDNIKGAGDYCDAATSVLLLERDKQKHKKTGGYAPVDPTEVTLYFPKTRDAVADTPPMSLKFNRQTLLFDKT